MVVRYRPKVLAELLVVPLDLYYIGLIGNVIMFTFGYLFGILC